MEILPARTKREIDSLPIRPVLDTHSTREDLPVTAGASEKSSISLAVFIPFNMMRRRQIGILYESTLFTNSADHRAPQTP